MPPDDIENIEIMKSKPILKNIWYPGSAYASQDWIDYLYRTFRGRWTYSDIHENWAWQSDRVSRRYTFDTINQIETQNLNVDTLIISWHPGLQDIEQILRTSILQIIKPRLLIYDPGHNIGNIEQHIQEIPQFSTLGYQLNKIVVLPHLHHQYCEYELRAE